MNSIAGIIKDAGHMVHHVATQQVVETIEKIARKSELAP